MNIGDSETLVYVVQDADLAKNLALDTGDDFPEVLATSRMIALMELAAARLMKPLLAEGELSVGVNVNADHLAATPNGAELKVVAHYQGMKGKLYSFVIELFDQGGKAGSAEHTRAIVKTERLLKGAQNRCQ